MAVYYMYVQTDGTIVDMKQVKNAVNSLGTAPLTDSAGKLLIQALNVNPKDISFCRINNAGTGFIAKIESKTAPIKQTLVDKIAITTALDSGTVNAKLTTFTLFADRVACKEFIVANSEDWETEE